MTAGTGDVDVDVEVVDVLMGVILVCIKDGCAFWFPVRGLFLDFLYDDIDGEARDDARDDHVYDDVADVEVGRFILLLTSEECDRYPCPHLDLYTHPNPCPGMSFNLDRLLAGTRTVSVLRFILLFRIENVNALDERTDTIIITATDVIYNLIPKLPHLSAFIRL